jgi:hypothetical protein
MGPQAQLKGTCSPLKVYQGRLYVKFTIGKNLHEKIRPAGQISVPVGFTSLRLHH